MIYSLIHISSNNNIFLHISRYGQCTDKNFYFLWTNIPIGWEVQSLSIHMCNHFIYTNNSSRFKLVSIEYIELSINHFSNTAIHFTLPNARVLIICSYVFIRLFMFLSCVIFSQISIHFNLKYISYKFHISCKNDLE